MRVWGRGSISQHRQQAEKKTTYRLSSISLMGTVAALCLRFRLDGGETREDINRSEVVAANILLLIIPLLKGDFLQRAMNAGVENSESPPR